MNPWISRLSIGVFLVLLIHGSLLGITDDEAYYWVLSQKPAWGYAYHPPAVAWVIAFFEVILTPLTGLSFFGLEMTREGMVRFPAALFSGLMVFTALIWMSRAGVPGPNIRLAGFTLLSFAGLFGASWMMVPDLPLMLGYILMLALTWEVCFGKPDRWVYFFLALSTAWATFSKMSACFAIISSVICIWIWAFPKRKWKAIAAVVLGTLLGFVPFLIFNIQNNWGPIWYQIADRHHGAEFSLVRYLRFWLIIFVAVGPPLTLYLFFSLKKAFQPQSEEGSVYHRVVRFLCVWMVPAALVFCVQPAFSEFKPHWALMVWLPVSLLMAYSVGRRVDLGWGKFQRRYGFSIMAIVLFGCHFPLGSAVIQAVTGKPADPRWDVTNDMYTWSELLPFVRKMDRSFVGLPVIGSRYQTAAQAAFAWGDEGLQARVARAPLSEKEIPEWPQVKALIKPGPNWSVLRGPVLFVADTRFYQPPEFPGARCDKLGRLQGQRGRYLAKWIDVWKCGPRQ